MPSCKQDVEASEAVRVDNDRHLTVEGDFELNVMSVLGVFAPIRLTLNVCRAQ